MKKHHLENIFETMNNMYLHFNQTDTIDPEFLKESYGKILLQKKHIEIVEEKDIDILIKINASYYDYFEQKIMQNAINILLKQKITSQDRNVAKAFIKSKIGEQFWKEKAKVIVFSSISVATKYKLVLRHYLEKNYTKHPDEMQALDRFQATEKELYFCLIDKNGKLPPIQYFQKKTSINFLISLKKKTT